MTLLFRARRAAPAALVAVLALGGAGCADDGDQTTATTVAVPMATTSAPPTTLAAHTVEVVVRAGSVQGGGRQTVSLNERIRLRVTSDVADEVHVHGYEHRFDVGPTGPAEITFVANLPGVFEVELEEARRRLLTLEVRP